MAEFFTRNIIIVYFFYGLSFFVMGLAVLLEFGHSSKLDFARALRPLIGFGLIHGLHEWLEMFLIIKERISGPLNEPWILPVRLIALASSFLFLIAFGARLVVGLGKNKVYLGLLSTITAVWVIGLLGVVFNESTSQIRAVAADVYTRYALAIPGAALTVWGLIIQRRKFVELRMPGIGRDVVFAAIAFGLYGGIGQLFASPSIIFPSTHLNSVVFLQWFGFPVQVFRALVATMAAVFITRSLRAFEVESNQRIAELRDAQLAEQQRLEEMKAELLHKTVIAQEAERQRIARELHDETGQTLTALGMGLRGMSETILTNRNRAIEQANQLEKLAVKGVEELQRMVSGLHPPQLDDLGLLAALRWYTNDVSNHTGIAINIVSHGNKPRLSSDVRSVVFRIAQEAITNTVRHAIATKIDLQLDYTEDNIYLRVEDNGQGFNTDVVLKKKPGKPTAWGLLGMTERATLVGGTCNIFSHPGKGTLIEVNVPIMGEIENA
ncbi:MAG TPA: sensor histidine kinase [Anaerolineales bacterium]|nr:sensor histidine kinase [Anaerolineales bacterium]